MGDVPDSKKSPVNGTKGGEEVAKPARHLGNSCLNFIGSWICGASYENEHC